jgi:hypothetical protein
MLLKKTKLASAVGLAVVASGALAAPTFDWTHTALSTEGASSATTFTMPTVTVTMGAEYAKDDLIELSFNADMGTSFTPTSTLTGYKKCTNGASPGVAITGTATENGGVVTLGLISNTTSSATYRITASTNAITSAANATNATTCKNDAALLNTTIGAVFATGTMDFDGASVRAAGSLTGTYAATLSNGVTALDGGSVTITDNAGTAATADDDTRLLAFGDQFSLDTTTNSATAAFSKVIDVTASPTRSRFTGSGTNATDAVLTVDIDDTTAVAFGGTTTSSVNMAGGVLADTEIVTLAVTGDWSFIEDENSSTTGIQSDAVSAECNSIAATSTTVAEDKSAVTVVCASGDVGNVVLTFEADKNGTAGTSTLTAGSYTMGATMTYMDAGADLNNAAGTDVAGSETLAAAGTAAGSFTLNGSTSAIQAYPVGSNIEQFVWVTNSGATGGDITMTATQGGTTSTACSLGTAAPKTLTSVSDAVNTCLTAAGITSGRAQVNVTVNAAATSVNVYAAYKVTSADDRLALTVTDGITD